MWRLHDNLAVTGSAGRPYVYKWGDCCEPIALLSQHRYSGACFIAQRQSLRSGSRAAHVRKCGPRRRLAKGLPRSLGA
jgi:hypothetical protein